MRVSRGLGELRLQGLQLLSEPRDLRMQPCNLLAQYGIAGCLDKTSRTIANGGASTHISSRSS